MVVKKRILVADDDAGIVEALQLMLEDAGYEVATTIHGETVLELEELPDLLLLDIWMSGIDGREICEQLKNSDRTRHMPVLLISANKDTPQIAEEAHADGWITKPFEMDELLTLIADCIGSAEQY